MNAEVVLFFSNSKLSKKNCVFEKYKLECHVGFHHVRSLRIQLRLYWVAESVTLIGYPPAWVRTSAILLALVRDKLILTGFAL